MHAHSPIYRIDMTVCTQGKAVPASGHCERSVGAYFDEDGMFAGADAFIADVDRVLGGCGSVGGRGKRE